MSEDAKLAVVVDHGGRQYIGKLTSRGPKELTLENHLKYQEAEIAIQNGSGFRVQLQLAPSSHLFNLNEIVLKWSSIEVVTDAEFIRTYEEFWTQIRASRSGIKMASSMPDKTNGNGIQVSSH